MATIAELEDGTLVTDGQQYARVKRCIHNNPFYAYIGTDGDVAIMGYEADEIENAVRVSDWDEDKVGHCCG